ncbi:hypothetical protein DN062_08015 [Nitrincola tibetensis]|uniref:Uncharacterized protein n=1 Tax=Nitrincola tibetensis TaxID=2219697 RepID=A0A364NM51_9GAMM|nr:hypothetical protein [Nitrincola tibetensis]RAU18176.1 hypothetical protein DN062_08015 [Nitrincola tibetensis]
MTEFFIIFVISAIFIGLVGISLAFGRSPSYRPERAYVLKLLQGIQDGTTEPHVWDMFIGYPIGHDPELELVRREIVAIHEGDENHPPALSGINDFIYDRETRKRLSVIEQKLETLIKNQPIVKDF